MLTEKQKILKSLIIPGFLNGLILITWFYSWLFDLDLTRFGIYPKRLESLGGIISAPFIHANFDHLFNNLVSLSVLSVLLFYFYRGIALRILTLTWILEGLWLWIGGREAYHVGASGIVYALAGFLFFSGMFRKDIRLSVISLLVVFMFGGLIWGIFPLKIEVSWESHLSGLIAGIILSFFYRHQGPPVVKMSWEEYPEEEEPETLELVENQDQSVSPPEIIYHYKPRIE